MKNNHYIVVFAASAGGLEALSKILSNLPVDAIAPTLLKLVQD